MIDWLIYAAGVAVMLGVLAVLKLVINYLAD